MVYKLLEELNDKLYFTAGDVAAALKVSPASAWTSCNRYVKSGYFIRIKRNLYITRNKWKNLNRKDSYLLANVIQVPSYISLTTALNYYNVTTQMQQGFIESIAGKRTKRYEVDGAVFKYMLINKKLYFGFEKKDDVFIASKEKAFIDAVYLSSFGKYNPDFTAVDYGKLDKLSLIHI